MQANELVPVSQIDVRIALSENLFSYYNTQLPKKIRPERPGELIGMDSCSNTNLVLLNSCWTVSYNLDLFTDLIMQKEEYKTVSADNSPLLLIPKESYCSLSYGVADFFLDDPKSVFRAALRLERAGILCLAHLVNLREAEILARFPFMNTAITTAMSKQLSTIRLGFGAFIPRQERRRHYMPQL